MEQIAREQLKNWAINPKYKVVNLQHASSCKLCLVHCFVHCMSSLCIGLNDFVKQRLGTACKPFYTLVWCWKSKLAIAGNSKHFVPNPSNTTKHPASFSRTDLIDWRRNVTTTFHPPPYHLPPPLERRKGSCHLQAKPKILLSRKEQNNLQEGRLALLTDDSRRRTLYLTLYWRLQGSKV